MLHRISLMLTVVLALLFGALSTTEAQACPGNVCPLGFDAAVTVQSVISCSVVRASLDFGTHFKSEGKASIDETNAGLARCTIDPQNGIVDISFTLPSVLTRVGGIETIPITFGNESLRLRDCDCYGSVVQGVNPAVAQPFTIASGFLTLALGQNGPNDPSGEVSVDLASASASGRYTGFITATVALR